MALSKILENSIAAGAVAASKLKDFTAAVDLNGVELVLDADGDTTIHASTDDQIDFKIANVEHISLTNSSGDTIIKTRVDGKDIKFQQFDGRTILDINDAGFVALANGATGPGELRIFEDTDLGSNYVGLSVGNVSSAYTLALPNADGSSGQALTTNGSGVLSFSTISTAFDDLTAGDAALNITTTAGNITIDAQGNDTDIIFKGTDGSSDRVFMTIDGSAGGDLFLTGGLIDLKNDGSAVSQIKFYCESSNAHAQTLIGAPHSESGTNTLTLPSSGGNSKLVSATSTATLTNKTLTSPVINTGTFGTSILPVSADGTTLGSATKEFSDLFLADASTIQFGADQDVTLTHVADTGLLLSSTDKLMFNDASQFIHAPSATVLDIAATDEIELTATLIDVVGNFTNSGTIVSAGVVTAAGFTIGSAVIGESELEILDGANVTTTELNLIDGDTSRGTTAVADADGLLINDDGTMRMTTAATVKTYMQSGLTSTSILDADSDTKIQVEESSDEDIIRYDVAGAEVATQTARGFEFTAVGGFMMNQTTNSQTFTIAATENAMVAGPIALSGTITVSGSLAVV